MYFQPAGKIFRDHVLVYASNYSIANLTNPDVLRARPPFPLLSDLHLSGVLCRLSNVAVQANTYLGVEAFFLVSTHLGVEFSLHAR